MPLGAPAATREEVYAAIDSERRYQDALAGNALRLPPHVNDPLVAGEGILCMEHLMQKAREEWYKPGGSTACMEQLRKVVAVGVQMMERYGAPKRAGYENP